MAEERHCTECGGELPADAPQGLCPQCLMKIGLPSGADAEKPATPHDQGAIPTSATPPGGFVPPEPAELAEKFPQLEILELLGQGGMSRFQMWVNTVDAPVVGGDLRKTLRLTDSQIEAVNKVLQDATREHKELKKEEYARPYC